MLDPISIISMTALIVAGISATNAFFDLIKTWRDRKKELKKRIEAAEHAFSTVPQVLKDNVASFKKLAGPKFDVGDDEDVIDRARAKLTLTSNSDLDKGHHGLVEAIP